MGVDFLFEFQITNHLLAKLTWAVLGILALGHSCTDLAAHGEAKGCETGSSKNH